MFGPSSALVFLPQSGQVRNLATLKDITVQLRSSKNIQNVKKLKLKMAAEAAEAGTGALALYETADIKAPEGKTSKHLLFGVTSDRHHPLCTITNRIPNQTLSLTFTDNRQAVIIKELIEIISGTATTNGRQFCL
uniref:Uncharacterized protein n=1 Tax=Oryzias latipes TaxID=8090 RepID=A0A3B3INC7_ORYLA